MSASAISAYRGDEPFIFISYAHRDTRRVLPELAYLADLGFRIYYDEGIQPGREWHDDLADAIERCGLFLFFATENSVQSRNCHREIAFAVDKEREILAVHLEPVELPRGTQLAIGNRQAILSHQFSTDDYRRRIVEALRRYVAEPSVTVAQSQAAPPPSRSAHAVGWLVALAITLAAAAYLWLQSGERAEQERLADLYSQFEGAIAQDDAMRAFYLRDGLSDEQTSTDAFRRLWNSVVYDIDLLVGTPDAKVEFRPYGTQYAELKWKDLGVTPLAGDLELPRGTIQVRVTRTGYRTGNYAVHVPGPVAQADEVRSIKIPPVTVNLADDSGGADDFVPVPETNWPIFVSGVTRTSVGDYVRRVPAFAVSRREVSNAEFKQFVDEGGYQEPRYWEGLEFLDGDRELAFAEARERFVDTTGGPGPAAWSLGHYPDGEGDLPVTGISWYEAMAYARYRDLDLPTLYHWTRYAQGPFEGHAHITPAIVKDSNFNEVGPLPITGERGLGPWGTYDTAGNVREWIFNPVKGGRLAMGGGFLDFGSDANRAGVMNPMERPRFVGLRLVRLSSEEGLSDELRAAVPMRVDDWAAVRQPMSDEAFDVLRLQFTSDKRQPVSVSIEPLESTDAWRLEQHTLSYEDGSSKRMFVMLPTRHLPEYQAVIYGPHGGAFLPGRDNSHVLWMFGFAERVARTGRMVIMPGWAGSLDRYRQSPPRAADPEGSEAFWQRRVVEWHQDCTDALSYIDTLPNVRKDGIGYFAESYGTTVFGFMLMSTQPRLEAGIFLASGLATDGALTVLDAVHYAPRVSQPMLMINGRFDPTYPHEQSQRPLFELLGTPEQDKRMVLTDGGHFRYPESMLSREIALWFNQYLGPVQ